MTPVTSVSSNRVLYLDALRMCATYAVIFLHVSASALYSNEIGYDWYVSAVYDSLVRWAVPVFVMISGAVFLNLEKDVSVINIWHKYIPRLLAAYLFWWVVYSFARAINDTIINDGFTFQFGYLVPHSHLWFLPMLMGVYLFIPLLRKIVAEEKLIKYALLLWGGWLILSFSLLPEIPQFSQFFTMNIIGGYLGYFILGRWLSTIEISKNQIRYIYTFGGLGLATTVIGVLYTNMYPGGGIFAFLNNLTPWVALMSIAVFVFTKYNIDRIKIDKYVELVRKDLFGIYLTHCIWLLLLNKPTIRGYFNSAIEIPILTAVIFLLSLVTTKLLRKIHLLRRVLE